MRRVGDHGKHISIRFDTETHDKLFYIAEYEGRSGSGQIMYLIRKCIAEFEKEHGKIEWDENKNGLHKSAVFLLERLAEFAPAGAKKLQFMFSGDMRVGEHSSQPASVDRGRLGGPGMRAAGCNPLVQAAGASWTKASRIPSCKRSSRLHEALPSLKRCQPLGRYSFDIPPPRPAAPRRLPAVPPLLWRRR